jgi:hypothetical protein
MISNATLAFLFLFSFQEDHQTAASLKQELVNSTNANIQGRQYLSVIPFFITFAFIVQLASAAGLSDCGFRDY